LIFVIDMDVAPFTEVNAQGFREGSKYLCGQ
jgi:hypothetical protein